MKGQLSDLKKTLNIKAALGLILFILLLLFITAALFSTRDEQSQAPETAQIDEINFFDGTYDSVFETSQFILGAQYDPEGISVPTSGQSITGVPDKDSFSKVSFEVANWTILVRAKFLNPCEVMNAETVTTDDPAIIGVELSVTPAPENCNSTSPSNSDTTLYYTGSEDLDFILVNTDSALQDSFTSMVGSLNLEANVTSGSNWSYVLTGALDSCITPEIVEKRIVNEEHTSIFITAEKAVDATICPPIEELSISSELQLQNPGSQTFGILWK